MQRIIKLLLLGLLVMLSGLASATAAPKPNVLFIAVDDLRPELGCYGVERMHTPNIDRIAANGTVFNRSYCMVAVCGASRASLMTGLRPAYNRFVGYLTRASEDAPGTKTLNTQFKENGYYTISNGKVFHHPDDNEQGWSEKAWRPKGSMTYNRPENIALHQERSKSKTNPTRGPAYEGADVADDAYPDGETANKAIADLKRLAGMDQPFFLAVGFLKPHLPFNCPQKYWDLYPADTIKLPETYHVPENAPKESIHTSGELRAYSGIPNKGPVSDETALNLIRGYYACVSYTDAQVGKVLDELERLKLADNTIVILWGDHGWNLGEHTMWCKHCVYETSMRAPLIISAPGYKGGQHTDALTEFIDIYPSLCDLAGLPTPAHCEGQSFVPLLKDPATPWKPYAIGRFGNGDTIRSDKYRFSEFSVKGKPPVANMLYDHDVDDAEDHNISVNPKLAPTVKQMSRDLHENMGKPSPGKKK